MGGRGRREARRGLWEGRNGWEQWWEHAARSKAQSPHCSKRAVCWHKLGSKLEQWLLQGYLTVSHPTSQKPHVVPKLKPGGLERGSRRLQKKVHVRANTWGKKKTPASAS